MASELPGVTADSTMKYKYGNASYNGLGKLDVRFPVTVAHFFMVDAFIVDADVYLLIGLDVLVRIEAALHFED